MKTCEFCGASLTAESDFCSKCGQRVRTKLVDGPQLTGQLPPTPTSDQGSLEFLGGPEDGRLIRLSGEKISVGRLEDNTMQIASDGALSRRHAFIYRRENQFWIEDRKSSFGTWVDGERVPVETATPMREGSLVRLANTLLVFHAGEWQETELQRMTAQADSR